MQRILLRKVIPFVRRFITYQSRGLLGGSPGQGHGVPKSRKVWVFPYILRFGDFCREQEEGRWKISAGWIGRHFWSTASSFVFFLDS